MSNVLDQRGTERAFRTAIDNIGVVSNHVRKLADSDRTDYDMLNRLSDLVDDLEQDRDAFRDWLRE